ncbi:MAG: hypothetical protein ACI92Z_002086 [Paracoccaceae bacterium]
MATVAVIGVKNARDLYFMDIAPKDQRVKANAVSRRPALILFVIVSMLLAAVAHSKEVVWTVIFITIVSLAAAIVSFILVVPPLHVVPKDA